MTNKPPPRPTLNNRIQAVLVHVPEYSFMGRSRLARDAGICRSAVSRLLNGKTQPTYYVVSRIAKALEVALGFHIDVRELMSEDGAYPTTFVCKLCRCPGCLPEAAFDEQGNRTPELRGFTSGMWTGNNRVLPGEPWQPIKESR